MLSISGTHNYIQLRVRSHGVLDNEKESCINKTNSFKNKSY